MAQPATSTSPCTSPLPWPTEQPTDPSASPRRLRVKARLLARVLHDDATADDLVAPAYHGGLARRDGALRLRDLDAEARGRRDDARAGGLGSVAHGHLGVEGLARLASGPRDGCGLELAPEPRGVVADHDTAIGRHHLEHVARGAAAQAEPLAL